MTGGKGRVWRVRSTHSMKVAVPTADRSVLKSCLQCRRWVGLGRGTNRQTTCRRGHFHRRGLSLENTNANSVETVVSTP